MHVGSNGSTRRVHAPQAPQVLSQSTATATAFTTTSTSTTRLRSSSPSISIISAGALTLQQPRDAVVQRAEDLHFRSRGLLEAIRADLPERALDDHRDAREAALRLGSI